MKILEESIKARLENLIAAGEQAFELLLEQVKKPIDEDLADDKARNAMKAKKECFMDAKEILSEVNILKINLKEERRRVKKTQMLHLKVLMRKSSQRKKISNKCLIKISYLCKL